MNLRPPYLSVYDPEEASEGSIDPLSLMPVYERLAERILPFLTVRMARPRFLTAMSVGAHVCQPFGDALATDGKTSAELVFEWHVVEAFVRRRSDFADGAFYGIPGVGKVARALRDDRSLSAATYLKTAKVFGFTGVYRRLAKGLLVLNDDLGLDEGGFDLLRAWEEDQDLEGFLEGRTGAGAQLREELRHAVGEGMSKGYTNQSSDWRGWEAIKRHLHPGMIGPKESSRLRARLFSDQMPGCPGDPEAASMRREFLTLLEASGQLVERVDEAEYFRALMPKASENLRSRLEAIDAYEMLCRPLEDAFRFILHLSTRQGGKAIDRQDFSDELPPAAFLERIRKATDWARDVFVGTAFEAEISSLFDRYTSVDDTRNLFDILVNHHEATQRDKPPDGKRPWVEKAAAGVIVRTMYQEPAPPDGADVYLHDYRSHTASTFLQDLGRLPR